MKLLYAVLMVVVVALSGCLSPYAPYEEIAPPAYDKNPTENSPYMAKPTDWDALFNKRRIHTREIHLADGGKVGYLSTISEPYFEDDNPDTMFIRHLNVYKVYDTDFNELGYYTPNGQVFKFKLTKYGFEPVEHGYMSHREARKFLLGVDGILDLKEMDVNWILSKRYPKPKESLPESPKTDKYP